MVAEQKNIKVVVRVRPYNRRELEQNQRSIIKVMDRTTLLFDPDQEDDEFFFQGTKQNYRDITKRVNKKLTMEYDRVYDTDTTNMQIFEECTAPLVDSVLNGYNCSVFVYGATGAGKTFTMLGSENCPGITFLTMRNLFDKIESQSDLRKFDVGVSYLEVYNEQVMNLLTKSGPLKLREDSNGVVVSGLVLKPIYSAEQLLELLVLGNSHRTQHPTDANAESSRSHAVFQVHIRITDNKTGTKRMVKLSMIDLAGSERAASTKGIGVRFKEGASINKSLLALGNCINKLADGLKHIPYRDSNLTRILKDSLGGNCQTLMVANVSMSSLTYEDTYNTLKYASRAKKIRTTLRQNALKTNMPKEFYVKKVNELMDENERLKQSNVVLEANATKASAAYDENELKPWFSRIDQLFESIAKNQEQFIMIKSRIKNLSFRIKSKNHMDELRTMLNIDMGTQDNFLNYNSSTCHMNKQIDKLKEELPCWHNKLQNAQKDLDRLKSELRTSKYVNVLQIYLTSKNHQLQCSKEKLTNKHITEIDSELMANSEWLKKAFSLSCDILRSSNFLGTEKRYHYEQLQRHLMGGNGLNPYRLSSHMNNDDIVMDGLSDVENLNGGDGGGATTTSSSDDDDEQKLRDNKDKRPCKKRLRIEEYNLDDFGEFDVDFTDSEDNMGGSSSKPTTFKMPAKRMRNLNETQILLTTDESDTNSTFYLGPSSSSTSKSLKPSIRNGRILTANKSNFVTNVLSDQVAKMPSNTDKLRNVLLKSKKFTHDNLLRTVTAGVQKENKKYSPNRVRKSPRAVVNKVFSTAASSMGRKQTTRPTGNETPLVKINRAASFRVKK